MAGYYDERPRRREPRRPLYDGGYGGRDARGEYEYGRYGRNAYGRMTEAEAREAAEREILRRRILERRRKKRMRRRIFLLILVIAVIAAVAVFALKGGLGKSSKDSKGAAAPKQAKGVIYLDPGHGGKDPGSQNEDGTRLEKDDTLKLALATREFLTDLGYKVVMSRETDEYVDRAERCEAGNTAKADLFVSIHRNAGYKDSKGTGTESWIPSDSDDKSRLLAWNIMNELDKSKLSAARKLGVGTVTDPNDDYKENSIPTMPSCIVEVGFMTAEADNLSIDENTDAYGEMIAKGIDETWDAIQKGEVPVCEVKKTAEFSEEIK